MVGWFFALWFSLLNFSGSVYHTDGFYPNKTKFASDAAYFTIDRKNKDSFTFAFDQAEICSQNDSTIFYERRLSAVRLGFELNEKWNWRGTTFGWIDSLSSGFLASQQLGRKFSDTQFSIGIEAFQSDFPKSTSEFWDDSDRLLGGRISSELQFFKPNNKWLKLSHQTTFLPTEKPMHWFESRVFYEFSEDMRFETKTGIGQMFFQADNDRLHLSNSSAVMNSQIRLEFSVRFFTHWWLTFVARNDSFEEQWNRGYWTDGYEEEGYWTDVPPWEEPEWIEPVWHDEEWKAEQWRQEPFSVRYVAIGLKAKF